MGEGRGLSSCGAWEFGVEGGGEEECVGMYSTSR